MMFLSLENVLKLPMVYHFSSKNNSTLKPRNLFWVGTEFLCRVPFLRVRSPMPDLPSGSLFWSWLKCPSCLRCEKESILLLAESWIILTLREGRLDRFVQNLVPSFQDWNLWINPIISSIYLVFTTAQHVMGQQFNRWVTTPYTAQGVLLASTTGMFGNVTAPLSFLLPPLKFALIRGWTSWGYCGKYWVKTWHRLIWCLALEKGLVSNYMFSSSLSPVWDLSTSTLMGLWQSGLAEACGTQAVFLCAKDFWDSV